MKVYCPTGKETFDDEKTEEAPPRHDLVERRLIGATTLVAAGGTTGTGGAAGSPGDRSGGS